MFWGDTTSLQSGNRWTYHQLFPKQFNWFIIAYKALYLLDPNYYRIINAYVCLPHKISKGKPFADSSVDVQTFLWNKWNWRLFLFISEMFYNLKKFGLIFYIFMKILESYIRWHIKFTWINWSWLKDCRRAPMWRKLNYNITKNFGR